MKTSAACIQNQGATALHYERETAYIEVWNDVCDRWFANYRRERWERYCDKVFAARASIDRSVSKIL